MSNQLQVLVNQDSPRAVSEGTWAGLKGTKRGEVCIVDFFTELALEGRTFQVRAGLKGTAITGGVAIVSTESEMCVDSAAGVTFMPFEVQLAINNAGGDEFECAGKSVAEASSSGNVFVPLPLLSGGIASRCTARAETAGACTVAAEAVTTTRQHFHYSEEFVGDDTNEEQVAGLLWTPKLPPVCKGVACFYVQIASATGGPGYFAHISYAELTTAQIT